MVVPGYGLLQLDLVTYNPKAQGTTDRMATFDLLIRNATCVSHRGLGQGDVGVLGGKTAAIGGLSQAGASQVIDATGLHLLPGVIDSQVHFREPGLEHTEDLESGSRDARHREGLWKGIADVLGSDHAPHTLEENARPYPASPSGMAGKGRLAVGWDADYTMVDMRASRTIEDGWIASRAGWTPFDGRKVSGWPIGAIIRGQRVMWDGHLANAAAGQPVRFNDTLQAHG
jgi:dihydroorotase-like cyclic amidohydrolase